MSEFCAFYWTASHTDLASLPMVTLLNFIAATDCVNKDFYTAIIYRAIIVMLSEIHLMFV